MLDLPVNVRQELMDLLPASIIQDISCFTFYSDNISENVKLDIIVCTTNGEIIEFYQRKPVLSLFVDKLKFAKDITVYKNHDNINYLVSTNNDMFVFNRKSMIELLKVIQNLKEFTIEDTSCAGIPKLKVWYKGDALPVILDDKFNLESDTTSPELFEICEEEEIPTLNKQKCKLVEAKYIVSQSEKTLNDIIDLRKKATFALYSKMYPQIKDVLFKKPLKEVIGVLRKQVERIGTKLCNKKIIVIHNVYNDSNEPLTDIEVILHSQDKSVLQHVTKLYTSKSEMPYWSEINTSKILSKEKMAIVTVIDYKEIKNLHKGSMELYGIILYKLKGKLKLLPIEPIVVTQNNILDGKLDVLSQINFDEKDLLAISSSSIETELVLTEYSENEPCTEPLCELLCAHLSMVKMNNDSNMVIHKRSPYHPLNGVMIKIENKVFNEKSFKITVFSRCQSQVMSLIHYMYDAIPYRFVITLPEIKISKKTDKMAANKIQNVGQYGACLRDQMTLILKYYDDCLLKMGRSSDEKILNMLGVNIDLLIDGKDNFEIFVNKLKEEIVKGFDFLNGTSEVKNEEMNVEVMIIDD